MNTSVDNLLIFGVLAIIFIIAAVTHPGLPAKAGPVPSPDIKVYIDQDTGCQYLYGYFEGGITPRLNEQGEHICGTSSNENSNEE